MDQSISQTSEETDRRASEDNCLGPKKDRRLPRAEGTIKSSGMNDYLLHSVLVHAGDVNGGHYYAYIRPEISNFWKTCESEELDMRHGPWFKFDDDMVLKVLKMLQQYYLSIRLCVFLNIYNNH